jgi:hypothetical protein
METKRAFKGIWIPAYVWNHPDLQPQDIQIWGEIDSFTHNDGSCFASNAWLSEKFNCTIRTIQRSLIRLRDAGLIEIELKGNPRNKETKRFIRSVNLTPTPRHLSHTPMTEKSHPHDTEVIHNNTKSNNTKSNNIKLHSPKFSEENIPGESDNLFSSIEATQEEPVIEPKKKANPFKLSDDEMNVVRSYYKGFIEEIDKVAQVEYSKDIRHLCRTFKLLKRNRELFCDIYIYFRTYRDPFETYTTEIRSLSSLAEKIDKLQAEMFRETKKVIKQKGSVVLYMDNIKKIAVVYGSGVLKKHDKTRIELMPKTGYTVYDISRSVGKLDFPELGYVERNTFA